jgi:hypothetical protein
MDEPEELDDVVRAISIGSSCEYLGICIMGHHSLVFAPATDSIPGTIHTYALHIRSSIFLFLTRCRCSWLRSCTDIFSWWPSECYLALFIARERLVLRSYISLHRSLALFPIGEYPWCSSLPDGVVFLFHNEQINNVFGYIFIYFCNQKYQKFFFFLCSFWILFSTGFLEFQTRVHLKFLRKLYRQNRKALHRILSDSFFVR